MGQQHAVQCEVGVVESTLVVALDGGVYPTDVAVVCTFAKVNLGGEQLVQAFLPITFPYSFPFTVLIS